MDHDRPAAQATSLPTSLPYRVVLHPHRSMTPPMFFGFMLAVGGVSFVAGMVFVWMGAWPVLGFFGLDVLLLYVAFKINFRSARAYEAIEVTRDDLTITRVKSNGRRESVTRLSPTWARLEANELPDGSVELALASHGRRVPIARHLGSDERRSFAKSLSAALRLVREPEW
jgi:uncharacterized membrane protein